MSAPILVLDPSSSVPPYEQIGAQMRLHIATGALLPGTTLPSVRQLAHDLGVAPNTVARAYSELEREGWVITSARRGVMVAAYSPALAAEARARELQRLVSQVLMTAYQLGIPPAEVHAELHRQLGIWAPGE
jgi:DNA-binding transcriptional regulator YhcF (GntR family)